MNKMNLKLLWYKVIDIYKTYNYYLIAYIIMLLFLPLLGGYGYLLYGLLLSIIYFCVSIIKFMNKISRDVDYMKESIYNTNKNLNNIDNNVKKSINMINTTINNKFDFK